MGLELCLDLLECRRGFERVGGNKLVAHDAEGGQLPCDAGTGLLRPRLGRAEPPLQRGQ